MTAYLHREGRRITPVTRESCRKCFTLVITVTVFNAKESENRHCNPLYSLAFLEHRRFCSASFVVMSRLLQTWPRSTFTPTKIIYIFGQ